MQKFKQLYSITSNSTSSFNQKIEALLSLGAEIFNLQLGIVSEINTNDYIVRYAISPDNSIEAGTSFALENTYCVHTLTANESTSFYHAGKSRIKQHPCYTNFGLESYIGTPLLVDGIPYGTLNFSSSEIRHNEFTEDDHDFIELLGHWVGNEISRNNKLQALESQQKEFERQQMILEDMGQLAGVGAWELDLSKNTVFWSSVTKQIHEVPQDYVPNLESSLNFYKEGDSRERVTVLVEQAIIDGGRFEGEFEIVTYTGKTKWVAVQGRAELDDGACVRLVGAFQDITQEVFFREQLEKRHKELSLALNARSVFLTNMSHEIRTPINGILGVLQVIKTDNFDKDQKRFIGLAEDSALSLLELINGLLDFAKIDSGNLEFEFLPINVNEFLEKCVEVFAVAAKEKSLKLDYDFSATDNIQVSADPTRIRQILANLLSNAIKFTHHGEIKIVSSIKRTSQNRVRLTINVVDTGIGISSEQLSGLFLPFRQADVSTTRKYGGTGLGLSISQQLAKLMNGNIVVESEPGEGSSFTLDMDLELIVKPSTLSVVTETAIHKDLTALRVLVVEDNEINQVIVCEMLRQKQIAFDVANDGLIALQKLREAQSSHFSLVLMDCQMPNMDGYEATRAIRASDSAYQSIPIVALTANAMPDEREKCLAVGMNEYLSKPININLLYETLGKFV
jgi:signal transduction histidine kinase/CheY-like chemotaxis protein